MALIVAERLAAKGLTYRAVSEATGIPLATLHRRLKGTDDFRFQELVSVAGLLGLKASTLVRESERAA